MATIQTALYSWYESHKRKLPWRSENTPYHVWLSEIILQQTRVEQGLEYYDRFISRWPRLEDLAAASEEEVLKMWQGLGYYTRARNLLACAREVSEKFHGAFPADYSKLVKLKGIGGYTAAAVASIAFNLPYPVVDGNVFRVIARLKDIDIPIESKKGADTFHALAENLLDKSQPGMHNQAVMEFGALQCVPKNPDCQTCPLKQHCLAFERDTVKQRPVKAQKGKTRIRHFNYLIFQSERDGRKCLHRRTGKDIWKNLYDFPLIESDMEMNAEQVTQTSAFQEMTGGHRHTITDVSRRFQHKLTHQTIIAQFIRIKLFEDLSVINGKDLLLANEKDMDNFPVPRLIDLYLNN